MKRNLKLTISALAVMLVMALAVTVVSFSLAGNDSNDGELSDEAVFVSATADDFTNIDNIIENSHATGTDANPVYRIVEIGSGNEPEGGTTFGKMILAKDDEKDVYGDFEEFVLNGNKSNSLLDMNPENIEYTYFNVNELKDEYEDNIAVVSNADLIYISNDSSNPYRKPGTNGKDDKGSDFDEEIYNLLHTYAIGDYKPLIIDKIGEDADSDDTGNTNPDAPVISTKYSFAKLIAKVFDRSGKYYYTFKWPEGQSVDDFISGKGDSDYLAINGDKKQQNWTTVTKMTDATAMDADPASKFQMAEFLIVSAGSKTMSNALLAELDASKKITGLEDMSDVAVEGDVYDIQGTKVYNKVYNGKKIRPHYVRVNTVAVADLENLDLDKYDMIILEEDCVNENSAIYNKLSAAMYGRVNIIYSSKLATEPSGSGSNGPTADNPADRQETNYSELFYMVATATGQKKYDNIMVTDSAELSIIANSESAATCKVIADLINASAFRGIGGQKDSSNKFTVLEIQPCYPIDAELAVSKNNYYTVPADVVNSKTKEELDPGTEYYAWELSKAKIAHAFNLTVDQVTLVQMSSEQFAATKEDVLGKYDLVYVGGNTTALKDALGRSQFGSNNAGPDATNASYFKTLEAMKEVPVYDMYSHNGDPIQVNLTANKNQGGGHTVGTPAANAVINGKEVASFSLLNGNDISYANLQKLKAYVNAGMPVVFSSEATNAYNNAVTKVMDGDKYKSKSKNYMQNAIDPDSNMYKFMDYCDTLTRCDAEVAAKNKNVLWGFNVARATDTDSDGGDLGVTQTGFVKVFDDVAVGELQGLYLDSNQRPKVTLTQSPAIYNMYDKSSYIDIDTTPLKFVYKVSGTTNYTATLYIDDDGNSIFDANEDMKSTKSNTLVLTENDLSEDYSGPVYWKLAIKDNKSKQETSVVGISYIAPNVATKQTVRVLQIMPGVYTRSGTNGSTEVNSAGESTTEDNSLYFCTICQQAYRRLEYNPSSDSGAGGMSYAVQYDGNYFDNYGGLTRQGNGNNKYLGIHEHEFGIVKYDSSKVVYSDAAQTTVATVAGVDAIGADDWSDNLASEVEDRYNFDLDIMVRSEFVVASDEAHAASYDFSTITNPDEKAKAIADAIAVNPYEAGTEQHATYEKATDDEKLAMVKTAANNDYETKRNAAEEEYEILSNYLIKYFNDEDTKYTELKEAFADYPYVDNLVADLEAKRLGYLEELELNPNLTYAQWRQANIDEVGYQMSSLDAEIDLRNALMEMRTKAGAGTLFGQEITRILECRHYWDFYMYGNNMYADYWGPANDNTYDIMNFNVVYAKYIQAKDAEILAHQECKKYSRYLSGSNWIFDNYDMVVIGASEDFAKDDLVQAKAVQTIPETISLKVNNYSSIGLVENINLPSNAREVTMNFSITQANNYNPKMKNITASAPTVVSTGTGAGNIEISGIATDAAGKPVANEVILVEKFQNGGIVDSAIAVTDAEGKYKVSIPNYTITHENVLTGGKTTKATNALLDLELHMKNDGKVFLFHDTVTKYSDQYSVHLTNLVRRYSGMDRYHMVVDQDKLKTDNDDATDDTKQDLEARLEDSYYVPYKTTSALGDDVYFMTDLSKAGGSTVAPDKYTKWFGELSTVANLGGISGRYLSADVYTDICAMPQTNGADHDGKLPYKYAVQDWATAAFWMHDDKSYVERKTSGNFGADKATKTNEGIVTLYPFTLSDHLNISATHGQAYALDLEDSNLTVWYSLAGGTGSKTGSSIFAASPNDGMDSYFIYTYKNFNYCGAGHANVTGVLKDNNDERRLYINIICNSVKGSVKSPGIDVYDYETEENKKYVEMDDTYYLTKVDNPDDYPEFSFRVRLDESANVAKVRIYYDLDCPPEITSDFTDAINAYEEDDKLNHPLILEWYGAQVPNNTLTHVYRYSRVDTETNVAFEMKTDPDLFDYDKNGNDVIINGEKMKLPVLRLREAYFEPYGGSYTYIVIEVTDTNGKVSYKRIKIQLKDKLFNLT